MGLSDDPALLRIPREFVAEAEADELDELGEALLVARLPKFSRTFFQVLFDEEMGMKITGMGDEERGLASDLTVDYEDDEEKKELIPLLDVFIDMCDLYIESEELSTPDEAGEHQSEILSLTARLLEHLSTWARSTGRPVLGGMGGDLARSIGRMT